MVVPDIADGAGDGNLPGPGEGHVGGGDRQGVHGFAEGGGDLFIRGRRRWRCSAGSVELTVGAVVSAVAPVVNVQTKLPCEGIAGQICGAGGDRHRV